MLTTTPPARAAFWLVSLGVHAAAFVATARAPASSEGARQASSPELSIDLAPSPEPEAEASPKMTPSAPSVHFVPRMQDLRDPAVSVRTAGLHASPSPAPALSAPAAPARDAVVEPELVAASVAPARFSITVAGGIPGGSAAPVEPGSDDAPLPEDGVSSPARLARPMSIQYPANAIEREMEADVVLSIVVTSAGDVADARVVRSSGFGFDESALRAAKVARFNPARRDGRRVAVRMRWTVSFRLR